MSCCEKELTVTAVALVSGTSATLTVADVPTTTKSRYCLRYCVTWNGATNTEALLITDANGTTYPVLTKLGNPVRIGYLRKRQLLYLVFSDIADATTGVKPHFTVCNELCPPCYVTPPTATAAAANG